MLIWPEWLGEQNDYICFCLKQHIKLHVKVKKIGGCSYTVVCYHSVMVSPFITGVFLFKCHLFFVERLAAALHSGLLRLLSV